ncbi:hypothetical protein ACOTF1_06585 [Achromobacter ruhlandii]|uniref:hypothetical protein n=1 Tax=Achromobacter ruhlandii TaxID=72557 RepID=UPI003B991C9B
MTYLCLRSYLELLYFLTGGPVLALIAWRGLGQIKAARDAMRQNEELESKRHYLQAISDFTMRSYPEARKIADSLMQLSEYPTLEELEAKPGNIDFVYFGKGPKWQDSHNALKGRMSAIEGFNHLELFARQVSVNHKYADDLFLTAGRNFVELYEALFLGIAFWDGGNRWMTAHQLYKDWRSKVEVAPESEESAQARATSILVRGTLPMPGLK